MKRKIAIVGSGISGLTAGFLLHKQHDITLFEAAPTLGGHTATVDVEQDGRRYAIDTGFIVFNDRTYPNFLALLARIGVARQPAEMSFSVKSPEGLEYNGHNLDTLFAQRSNLLSPRFYGFVAEILRFNREARAWLVDHQALDVGSELTLGDFLQAGEFSDYFARHYILPMGAAIWSSTLADMRTFPLGFFLRFFAHHGLLEVANRPQWYVIPGGSREYIGPLTAGWQSQIRLACPVAGIRRVTNGVIVQSHDGEEQFDEVIFACHSDQALALLTDASERERAILGAMPYQANDVWLHTDATCLPVRRKAWASWNYQLGDDDGARPLVSYNMNILQGVSSPEPFCVSLNPAGRVDESKVLRRFVYHHPVFNQSSIAAQQRRLEICGQRRTHFCGAYWYNGFHEDGVRSALDVAMRFGAEL
ncbi:NAD(P)/FAD-dependent oxidoreductase [Aeromonas enteropelogenes]|uniref:NAD(P)/FAD-dependent oxidoreductase n=1 Tax=Aeromonas enteropelogenes TaxID=29489 RepID=UPI001CBC12EF|nr:FAD-dependent oxidoreductase [Aeromonas enteropelogenes]UAK71517.1 FAD-dependent oxidoreductase [Aeromonas enteropelogenes]